jgi:2-polyprenyl-6-methoxyphenol hydroxylase-like FAD-dependent oxidoreductase
MNTGIQDAMNLAWKLALVIQKTCDEQLLDSYSPERSAVGDEVLKAADRLTEIGTTKNPIAQAASNFVGHVMLGLSPLHEKGIWLVRPDGYVAMSTSEDGVQDVATYLARLIHH